VPQDLPRFPSVDRNNPHERVGRNGLAPAAWERMHTDDPWAWKRRKDRRHPTRRIIGRGGKVAEVKFLGWDEGDPDEPWTIHLRLRPLCEQDRRGALPEDVVNEDDEEENE
jgi:hypothetical protein